MADIVDDCNHKISNLKFNAPLRVAQLAMMAKLLYPALRGVA
jgi:hypothetical protein